MRARAKGVGVDLILLDRCVSSWCVLCVRSADAVRLERGGKTLVAVGRQAVGLSFKL